MCSNGFIQLPVGGQSSYRVCILEIPIRSWYRDQIELEKRRAQNQQKSFWKWISRIRRRWRRLRFQWWTLDVREKVEYSLNSPHNIKLNNIKRRAQTSRNQFSRPGCSKLPFRIVKEIYNSGNKLPNSKLAVKNNARQFEFHYSTNHVYQQNHYCRP